MAAWEYPAHKELGDGPTLGEVDPRDRAAVLEARERKLREDWIRIMEVRLLREALNRCYKTEDVNHHQNCRKLVEQYMKALKESRVEGYLGQGSLS